MAKNQKQMAPMGAEMRLATASTMKIHFAQFFSLVPMLVNYLSVNCISLLIILDISLNLLLI